MLPKNKNELNESNYTILLERKKKKKRKRITIQQRR